MNNKEKYDAAFCEAFEISEEKLPGLKYQDVEQWDSVGHMTLMALLEEAFDIMMETDDIIEFSSYEVGMKMLSEKYDVEF